MNILFELEITHTGTQKTIFFGVPETAHELEQMFRLRYDVYSARGYIRPEQFSDRQEKDSYDEAGKCDYVVASLDEKIIGAVRLIYDEELPTEKECFSFSEPAAMREIPRNQRAELGRLIVVPPSDEYLPRNIIMLCLIKVLVDIGITKNILGGYAFIKKSLEMKLETLRMPIHRIHPYQQVYPAGGMLSGYFSQKQNPAIPMYFLTEEFRAYTDRLMNKRLMFKRIGATRLALRRNIYNVFLRFLHII